MATYSELFSIRSEADLLEKVTVAVVIAAESIRTDATPPANQAARLVWASQVFADPGKEARRMLWALLAANESATLANILGATDAAIQANVDVAVDLFADNP